MKCGARLCSCLGVERTSRQRVNWHPKSSRYVSNEQITSIETFPMHVCTGMKNWNVATYSVLETNLFWGITAKRVSYFNLTNAGNLNGNVIRTFKPIYNILLTMWIQHQSNSHMIKYVTVVTQNLSNME